MALGLLGQEQASTGAVDLHERSAMRRVFTVEDEQSVVSSRCRKETLSQLLLITEVHCTFNVSAIVLILEAAIDDRLLIIHVIVGTVEHLDERVMGDARKALGFRGSEMRQLE